MFIVMLDCQSIASNSRVILGHIGSSSSEGSSVDGLLPSWHLRNHQLEGVLMEITRLVWVCLKIKQRIVYPTVVFFPQMFMDFMIF